MTCPHCAEEQPDGDHPTSPHRVTACLATLFVLLVALLILATLAGFAAWVWRSAL